MVTNKRIGVLMGGQSAEREVSLRSGQAVYRALKERGYDAVALDVGPDICRRLSDEGVEVAFIALHGGHGENGAIQGVLEILGIPYTGSGILASALAMDKELAKKVFSYHAIPVPPSHVLADLTAAATAIGFDLPWVVKPAAEGSSIGVSIVKSESELARAVSEARKYGPRVLIERYIEGKEVQIGILGGRAIGGVEVRPTVEFYSYAAKYTPGLTEYVLPPDIDGAAYERAAAVACAAHAALGCRGATRVDLRITPEGNPYVLEVNTIPGMTETSLLPKIALRAGLPFPELVEEIVREALHESE